MQRGEKSPNFVIVAGDDGEESVGDGDDDDDGNRETNKVGANTCLCCQLIDDIDRSDRVATHATVRRQSDTLKIACWYKHSTFNACLRSSSIFDPQTVHSGT